MEYNVGDFVSGYDFLIRGTSYAGTPKSNTAMFISKKVEHLLSNLDKVENCLVFVETGMVIPDELKHNNAFMMSANPQCSYALFADQLAKLVQEEDRSINFLKRADGTVISEKAIIGQGSYIEPNCYIGPNVSIGKNAYIHAGAVIKNATIGDNFVCNESAIIGSDSYTMADDSSGNKIRIPALGRVVIGDNVEVGPGDNIARGTCGNTMIDDYVKLDALVHVAHEVHIFKNAEITAGVIIAGFATIGERSYVGINASFRNRVTAGENCYIGMGTVVARDIDADTSVAGNPARLIRT